MSVLPPEVHTALSQLLQGLQSTDNAARTQAEEQLNTEWVAKRPDMLLMGLAEQAQGAEDDGVSMHATIFQDVSNPCRIDALFLRRRLQKNSDANIERSADQREQGDLPPP